jgi:hypothetical protein
MDHRDRLRFRLAGVGCTAYCSILAADRIRQLLGDPGRDPAGTSRPG